ncbi:MAG TPA: M20/M25/M40 family metallo-hydrolase [Gemmatimonadaceae bacterium]|nr:M20/M25/M40 family metallo-hydrolase [Gemmatimonadaceae bacterium]
MHLLIAVVLSCIPLLAASAQSLSAPVRNGLESITEADVQHRIGIIAHDSMAGRDTPSRGLDLTAAWIASEFKRFGLKPALDDGSFLQRYPLSRRSLDVDSSFLAVRGNHPLRVSFRTDAVYSGGDRGTAARAGAAIVLAGTPPTGTLTSAALKGNVAVIPIAGMPGRAMLQRIAQLGSSGPALVVLVTNADSAAFSRIVMRQSRARMAVEQTPAPGGAGPLVVTVREKTLAPMLRRPGLDLARLRRDSSNTTVPLAGSTISARVIERVEDRTFAPNVVGVLEGTDPVLRNEYVVFSAHMDHVGIGRPVNGDSIFNGADDDASGTVGVVELAEAFSRPGARPKRSLIFLTVSGEEKGLWGSAWFAEHSPVPMERIVADLNMDMIGRNWTDTIVVIGKEHSDLGATLNRVNAAHPELNMNAIDDIWPQENFYFRSDHYNFARKGVPILFFFNGTHPDYHRPGDSVDKIDAEKESRIIRLVYLIGQEVGNAAERPKWNPESYKRIVQDAP